MNIIEIVIINKLFDTQQMRIFIVLFYFTAVERLHLSKIV